MSRTWQAGQPVQFDLPLIDVEGAPISASAATFRINDADGVELAAGPATVNGGTAGFQVPLEALIVPAGVSAEGREVVLDLETSAGPVSLFEYAVVTNRQSLSRFKNTVVTYPEALALRYGFGPVLDAWDAADDGARVAALIHAFENLSRVSYAINTLKEGTTERDYAAYGTGSDEIFDVRRKVNLTSLNPFAFKDLPARFQTAISRAQLVEADVILGGDQVSKIRESGIISETIGESSTFYNSKPFLNLPMSRRAYELLKPFITIRVSIGR